MTKLKTQALGLKISTLRKEHGLNQEEFAAMCNISTSYLSLLENGHKQPGYKLIHVIAKKLNTTKDKLEGPSIGELVNQVNIPEELRNMFKSLFTEMKLI